MVGVAGFEPAATRSQAEYSTKLSYTPILEPSEGFEPPTRRLQGAYSTLLSYDGINIIEPGCFHLQDTT